MSRSIVGIAYKQGRKKGEIQTSDNKAFGWITAQLSDGSSFDFEIDEDGDLSITASDSLEVVFLEENRVVLRLNAD